MAAFSCPSAFVLRDDDPLVEWAEGGDAKEMSTSNCQRSTCSPVALLVMTITRLLILPLTIHLFSWDMIRLMYDLIWSSEVTFFPR